MLGVEVEREAQIYDRRQLVALGVASGAKPVQDLGGAFSHGEFENVAASPRPGVPPTGVGEVAAERVGGDPGRV